MSDAVDLLVKSNKRGIYHHRAWQAFRRELAEYDARSENDPPTTALATAERGETGVFSVPRAHVGAFITLASLMDMRVTMPDGTPLNLEGITVPRVITLPEADTPRRGGSAAKGRTRPTKPLAPAGRAVVDGRARFEQGLK